MDNNNDSNEEDELQPTFRIRFTITSNANDNNCEDGNSGEERECKHQVDRETRSSSLNRNKTTKLHTFQFLQPENHKSSLTVNLKETERNNYTMSQGCNFMNSLMSASRRRSSSMTPQAAETKNNGRRAPSLDDLVAPSLDDPVAPAPSDPLAKESNETICGTDSTQINRPILNNSSGYVQLSAMNIRSPLQIEVNDWDENSMDKKLFGTRHPVSLDDILQIDLDEDRLEEERKKIEGLVEIWERKVDEMERRRFADDVPRTLIEKVLKQRKELRDLERDLYMMDLEESFDQVFPSESEDKLMTTATSRSGSHLRPGQENTADILKAIPPASSFQFKQYLSRASSGTDSSEYSQIPNYDTTPHKHPLQNIESDQRHRHYQSHIRQQHNHHNREQQQIYVQLDSPEVSRKPRSSPIRPNYFKDDFKSAHVIVSQDSSSTASSSSPH